MEAHENSNDHQDRGVDSLDVDAKLVAVQFIAFQVQKPQMLVFI